MKKPGLNDYPITDERTFINLDNSLPFYNWEKYAKALNQYIDFLEKPKVNCGSCKYGDGWKCNHTQGCEGEYELWEKRI